MSRVSRWLRARRAATDRPLFTVQLMRPSGSPVAYDLVALPWHDTRKRRVRRWIGTHANVVITTGMANLVTPARLAAERARWHERLSYLPRPVLAVAIGGDSRHRALRPQLTRQLMDGLLAWGERTGGSLLVTTSRRSGQQIADMIAARLKRQPQVPYRFWRPDRPEPGENPYLGYLAYADAMVVTDDSLLMAIEGMTAGLPVYLCGDEGRQPAKFQTFFGRMQQAGRLTRWRGELGLIPPARPLMDAERIATFVRARWLARVMPPARWPTEDCRSLPP